MRKNPKRILIVDDSLGISNATQFYLTSHGHKCDVVNNSKNMFIYLQQNKYDVILMDICLGNENGIELSREIKKINPTQSIVAFTGYSKKINPEDNCLFKHVLEKPFSPNELIKSLI